MNSAHLRTGRLRVLATALLLPFLGLASCGKDPSPATPSAETPATPPPGAKNDDPVIERVNYADLEYAADGTFTHNGKKFTGTAEEFHKDGTTLSKLYEFRDGKFDGTTREYYANGQISASTQWQEGQRHGANMYWNEHGKATKRQRYEHDVAVETVVLEDAHPSNP
jgi:hypothetical protein